MYESEIEYLIRSLGIGATYRGYRYVCYALELCMEDEDYLLSVSKVLYPQIARQFHTSYGSVERDIRTVIRVCWERGNRSRLEDIALHPLTGRPSTSEFLDILTAFLHRNMVHQAYF